MSIYTHHHNVSKNWQNIKLSSDQPFSSHSSRGATATESKNQNMSSTRTIFLRHGLPTVDQCGLFRGTLWFTVRLSNKDRQLSDYELMNLTIERLRIGEFTVDSGPVHRGRGFCISFPVSIYGASRSECIAIVIRLVKCYRADITSGDISIDRDFLFRSRALIG